LNSNKKNINLLPDETKTVAWRSPSNIALIKYWGKKGFQIPANPSLSMTLKKSFTETEVTYSIKKEQDSKIQFFLNDNREYLFEKKVAKYFELLVEYIPFLDQLVLTVRSKNSFPHSAGIASSASGMSALALCLCSIEKNLYDPFESDQEFYNRASYLARLGSGSACRSVYKNFVLWGQTNFVKGSSDKVAIPLNISFEDDFYTLRNTILIVDSKTKKVSSRMGHTTMDSHTFADQRYEQANHHISILIEAMISGDWGTFIKTVESEAMALHGMMMTAQDPFLLISPETVKIINKIVDYRKQTEMPVCFTLDAGPNVHVLYPAKYEKEILSFIENELVEYCEDRKMIKDGIGKRPEKII